MVQVGRLVKDTIVRELSTVLEHQGDVFIARVQRLSAPDTDLFRKQLHATQSRLVLMKRTLVERSLTHSTFRGVTELLEGSVGVIVAGEDVLPVAKILVEFSKTHEAGIAIRGAVIDGQLLTKQHVEHIAQLPPKPMLRAQVVGAIETPLAALILTVEQLISDLVWIADQASTQQTKHEKPGGDHS